MRKRSLGLVGLLSMLFLVLAAGPALAYGPNAPTLGGSALVVAPGGTLDLAGANFVPLEAVSLVGHSTPATLGSVQAGANGDFSAAVTIPSTFDLGAHEIVATGSTGDSATFAFTVADAALAVPAVTPATPTSSGSSGALAFTGTNAVLLSCVGAGALGAGGLLILVSRKRRSHISV